MPKDAVVSETVLRIDAAEIGRLRVVCGRCRGVAELPIDDLHKALAAGRCCFCGAAIVPVADANSHRDPFARLQEALRSIARLGDAAAIEFVVRPPTDQATAGDPEAKSSR